MAPPSAIEVEATSDTSAIVIPDPLTINGVPGRRAKSGRLIAGTAAPANSDMFKGHGHGHKPMAHRWDHYLSHEAASRKGNSLKGAAKYLKTPGLISLGGGLPSSEYFPFEELHIK
ncbi:Aromatic/aminoadipate aminotransferase 1, partial [Cryomyces antarcticus]